MQTDPPAQKTGQKQAPAQVERYANMPVDAVPFRRFTKPYKDWFVDESTLEYNGAADDRVDEATLNSPTVNIGFLGPIENNPESPYGLAMLHGAQLAVADANARGGYRPGPGSGKPYALKVHNDSALWGASSVEGVHMVLQEHCIGVLGSIDGASTHIMLRTSLKLEFPIVDTGTTDPTVTETRIQWLLHDFPDDRQQGYALADYVFHRLNLKRIGVLRTQSRYARIGVQKFVDEARRMGHQPILEVKFERGDKDFSTQLRMLQDSHIQGLVIWGEPPEAALILEQMRAMGMKQPVFGSSRLAYPELLEAAGAAAEGLVTTAAVNPSRSDSKWQRFREEYLKTYHQEPDAYAARAYDGMDILIAAIEKAGLNRGKVMDVLRGYEMKSYDGVTGKDEFDYTLNNVSPVTMTRVEHGEFVYWTANRRDATQQVAAGR
jgi:branched-chain amino acid transport system substrate-binding protein